jgi:DNA polymerase-1
VEVEDITTVPLGKLLRYNLIDGLSTWYVYGKNYPQMVQDQQLEIYETLFKPTVWDIIQMQLTGLPLNMARVAEVKKLLEADNKKAIDTILNTKVVQQYTYRMKEQWVLKKNSELKKKRVTLADAAKIEFNPNSGPQLQDLLYNMLGLPVLDRTAKKNPSTTGDTLKKLVNHTDDPDVKTFLMAMQDFADVDGMLTTFIPAFEDAMPGPDGWHYLVGSFRLGGTLSGRLSSRNPNMQNLPANSRYAKLIKSCIQAPPGWLFCGLDFLSLEDRISALTTKDPNKLKVYVGHEVYEVTIDGVTHHIRDDATVVFDGRNMTAQEFYEAHRSV